MGQTTDRVYRDLFELSIQGMVLRQGDKIVLVNQAFADIVGYSIPELLAFSFEESLNLIHPDDLPVVQARYQERLGRQGGHDVHEYRFVRRNGEVGWWTAAVTLVMYQGKTATLGVYLDVTERKQAEEQVRRGRELLSDTLDTLPVGVCLTDESGHYRMMNDAYCAIYEYDREEMLGQHYSVIMPPDQVAIANAQYARLLSGDMGIPVERKRQRKDGSIITIEAANALVKDSDGHKMVITTVRDITDRKQAQAQIEELARSLAGRVKELNCLYGVAQLIEEPDASLEHVAKQAVRIIPPAFQHSHHACARITIDQHTFASDGFEETPLRLSMPIMASGAPVGSVDICYTQATPDSTGSPFTVEERTLISAIAEHLGRLVERERTDETLKQTNTELKAHNEDLNAFAHTVAHDLKNPIAVVAGFAETLQDDYTGLSPQEIREQLGLISSYARKMSLIIDNLLLLSNVRAQDRVALVPLDMGKILANIQGQLRPLLQQYQGVLVLQDAWPAAQGNPAWIEQVWVNFISNALKYGGQPPQVELGADTPKNGQVRFWVKDNGPGLSPDDQRRIFQPFARLEPNRAEGHGLGLSIVRRIVERLGGEVGVVSTIGHGSTFFFTLPANS